MLAPWLGKGCPPGTARRFTLQLVCGCRRSACGQAGGAIALEARMTPWTLRWVTGGVAALSTAFPLSALPLLHLSRHTVPGGWNVPDVFEELTYPSRMVRALHCMDMADAQGTSGARYQRPYAVPERLDLLRGRSSGTVQLPSYLDWSGNAVYDLDAPGRVVDLYRAVLIEAASPQDLYAYLDE